VADATNPYRQSERRLDPGRPARVFEGNVDTAGPRCFFHFESSEQFSCILKIHLYIRPIDIAWLAFVFFAPQRGTDDPPFEIVLNSPDILSASDSVLPKGGFS
jgi:hypothetical protein